MPSSFNGFGSMYYGRRDMLPDGSYITTEWTTVAYIPLIPLASHRVRPTGKGSYSFFYDSTEYMVQRVPLNWAQVRNVYTVVIGAIAVLFILLFPAW